MKLVKSEACAAEILQDTLVTLRDKRKNIDPKQSFRAYLFCIAENKVYDFFAKAARDKRLQVRFIGAG